MRSALTRRPGDRERSAPSRRYAREVSHLEALGFRDRRLRLYARDSRALRTLLLAIDLSSSGDLSSLGTGNCSLSLCIMCCAARVRRCSSLFLCFRRRARLSEARAYKPGNKRARRSMIYRACALARPATGRPSFEAV